MKIVLIIFEKDILLQLFLIFLQKNNFFVFFYTFYRKKILIMDYIEKNSVQAAFFARIKKAIPQNQSFVPVLSDLLGISEDAVYKRQNGKTSISMEEAIKLSRHFHISLDSLTGVANNQMECEFTLLNLKETQDYLIYVKNLASFFDRIRKIPENEIIITAADVPAIDFFSFRELTLFQLFSWNKIILGVMSTYDEFARDMNTEEELMKYYGQLSSNYQSISSTEIWTDQTIESILRLLRFHYEMGHFSDQKTPLLLCDELMMLMNTLESWAETGTKGINNAPYKLYLSEIDIGNTYILFKNEESTSCITRLFASNGLSFSDERFCREIGNWLQNLTKRSTLISVSSEKERVKFFNAQRQKVRDLKEKMQLS